MNKTLSVNIGGIVFHIEELAYDRLNKYLDSIKGYFTTSDGRDEIIQDIEGRIAEMLQERITNGKQVIVEADVDAVINIMGKPEQFAGEPADEQASAEYTSARQERRTYRRLYRDPDDRVIGGVCSGFSHYIGTDPVWLRLAFAISFFIFGSGFLLYLILMIVLPKANTTAEKLEMKGEKVNISNIKRSVQEEMDAIRGNMNTSRHDSGITRFFDALGQILGGIFRVIGKIIAVFFVIIGMIILVAFLLAFLAIMGVGGISVPFIITDLFMSPWQQSLAMIGGFLVIGIPLIMIIFKAIKVLFNIKMESRIINWTALSLWIVGVVLSIMVATSIGREFKARETQRSTIAINQPVRDTLFLDVMTPREFRHDWYYVNNHRINDPWTVTTDEDTIRIENVRLDVVKSETPNFELVQVVSSRGRDRKDASDNARNLVYHMEQNDSLIRFDETFMIPRGSKYRDQKIQFILKVPVGKSVYFSNDMDNIIYDIKNVTNTYDGDMVGKTWTMTGNGLECEGCNLEGTTRLNKKDNVRIQINGHGVKVEGVDENNNDSSMHIKSKDVNINITDDGVQIDAKK